MKKKTKEKIKKIGKVAAWVGGTLAVGSLLWVFGHDPKEAPNSWRASHCKDGKQKVAFDTAIQANWQSLKQLVLHGQICNSYKVGDKYYTGHIPGCPIKSINPIKGFK